MVDFQSRETNLSLEDDEDDDEQDGTEAEEETEAGGDAETDETTDEQDETSPLQESTEPAATVSVALLQTEAGADDAVDAVADALDGPHEVLGRDARTGDLDAIQDAVNTFVEQAAVDAVVTVGGVGVGPDQVTVEAVRPLLETELPGFGELFRRRHAETVGSEAIRSRALGGTVDGTAIFCLPADADAAATGAEELVAPEVDWLVTAAED